MTLSTNVYGGSLELDDEGLILNWRGMASSREQRRSSPRRISFSEIKAIHAHPPSGLSQGWIRFGPDNFDHKGFQPPKDLFSVVYAHADKGYATLLTIASEVSQRLQLVNPLPEPVVLSEREGDAAVSPEGKWADVRPDIAAAATRMRWTMGGKREIRNLESLLLEGEEVEELAQGKFTQNQGIVALTDQRLLFLFHGFVNKRTEEFALEAITAVEVAKSFNIGTLRLRMSGNSCEITNVVALDLDRMANAVRNRIRRQADPLAPAPPAADDPVTLIERLGGLRDAGLLSETEYETKKQELLRRL